MDNTRRASSAPCRFILLITPLARCAATDT